MTGVQTCALPICVGRGKLLVTLEAAESSAQASAAAAQVAEAERALDEARARKRLADATYERYANLFKDEAVTRQEMDNRRADRDVAEQGVERATARLTASRENARAAGVVAGYTRIVSPLAGVVTAKQVENGMTVFPGTPLVTIEGDGGRRLEASVPESLAGRVRLGQRVPVTIDGAGLSLEGQVVEIVPAADPASRTFTVKVDLAGAGIRSGMFGRAFIATGQRQGILVPKSAVMERGALSSVWTLDQGNVARLRLVKTGKPLGDRIEIRIRDNGAGIPPEVKEKIFNPFFTTKPAGEGTGLGLSLSHDIIVKQHAGVMDVETVPGEFTEFRIVLPRRIVTAAQEGRL